MKAMIVQNLTYVCDASAHKGHGSPCFPVATKDQFLIRTTNLLINVFSKEYRACTWNGIAMNKIFFTFLVPISPKVRRPFFRMEIAQIAVQEAPYLTIFRYTS